MWPLKKKPVVDRWAKLCGGLDIQGGIGLEMGPLDRPLVPKSMGNIRYVDLKSAEELKRLIPVSDKHSLDNFVEIDFVWNGGRLADLVGSDIRFDYVLASHVIEHTADMIGWLNDLASVLKPGGIISLAIPDKRRTFDVLRAPTTAAMLVADHIRGETQPRAHHVYDHCFNAVRIPEAKKPFVAFCEGRLDPHTFERYHTGEESLELARKAEIPGTFTNCHTYVFTLESFLDVVTQTRALGLHKLAMAGHHPTTKRGAEFFVRLRAP